MASGIPTFQLEELPLFSDYGFDPHIDYLQELFRGARRKENKNKRDPLRFKLQNSISKDHKSKNKRTKWWKKALMFWKLRRTNKDHHVQRDISSKPVMAVVSAM